MMNFVLQMMNFVLNIMISGRPAAKAEIENVPWCAALPAILQNSTVFH